MGRCVFVWVLLSAVIGSLNIVSTTSSTGARSLDLCRPLVVAHRGASGYVPEHTLGAYALAITMGADYVEPDLVMTSDGHLIARHENQLSLTTDVAERPEFASRYRSQSVNGVVRSDWFTEHFTLAEIKTLRSREARASTNIRPGNTRMNDAFVIPTLQEIIDLVKSLQVSEQRVIGIYPEIKYATHFQQLGLAMEYPLVNMLHSNGYRDVDAPIYIQSFEVSNLKELKNLTDLRLVQLYGARVTRPYDQIVLGTRLTFGEMATPEGLREVATYAYGVGPPKTYIIPTVGNNLGSVTTFVEDAHAAGLLVHPYTFRAENQYLPAEFRSSDNMADIGNFSGEITAYFAAGIDGIFTDQPDVPARIRGYCRAPIPSSSTLFCINSMLAVVSLSFLLLLSK